MASLAIPPILCADEPSKARVREAIEVGVKLVQNAARNYPDHRDCFSCHHQTLPMFAMDEARASGFTIDEALLAEQAEFTRDFYRSRVDRMRKGEGVGGRGFTAGYALWALDIADDKKDAVSDALIEYLVKQQKPEGHWQRQSHRPPLEESHVTSTYLGAYYIERMLRQDASGKEAAEAAMRRAREWLDSAKPKSLEDKTIHLFAADQLGNGQEVVGERRKVVLDAQREDGGWSQLDSMDSDAYATGQALYVLLETAGSDPPEAFQKGVERGVAFLLKTRKDDGSWHVVSRSKPIQRMFDNGDPHGKDQFISTPATAWSVAALARYLRR